MPDARSPLALCSLAFTLFALAAPAPARADDPPAAPARSTSDTGTMLARPAPGQPWRLVAQNEALPAGQLLVGGSRAVLESANGAVQLAFRTDLDRRSPYPMLETAVVLQDASGADLALTLDRGRIDLTNRKADGPARVRMTVRTLTGEFTLGAGARVAVEVYGRWPKGVPFTKDPKPGEGPALAAAVLALAGKVELQGPTKHFTLEAPPGPALLLVDDLAGYGGAPPRFLDKAPEWADAQNTSDRAKKLLAAAGRFRQTAMAQSIDAALDALLNSDDEADREVGIILCGALDDLPRLGAALARTKHRDVWDTVVVVLRHWIGRAPGQDQRLYQGLVEKAGYKPAEAETVLQLLHSPFAADQPETYETLLAYLNHNKLAIRELAWWHLSRLVPKGPAVRYDPAAPAAERRKAHDAWKALIPSGSLPPAPKK